LTPVVLLELERDWGRTVVQRLGDGPESRIELRAFARDGSSRGGVAIRAAELPRVVETLAHERNTIFGHPKHTGKRR
jgi:hypothetical protein